MPDKVRIALDAMGGDEGASVAVPGADLSLQRHGDIEFLLFGDEAKIGGVNRAGVIARRGEISDALAGQRGAVGDVVHSLREACLDRSDAQGLEQGWLPTGVTGTQIRHQIRATFVAQSLLSAGAFARLARSYVRSSGPARCAE